MMTITVLGSLQTNDEILTWGVYLDLPWLSPIWILVVYTSSVINLSWTCTLTAFLLQLLDARWEVWTLMFSAELKGPWILRFVQGLPEQAPSHTARDARFAWTWTETDSCGLWTSGPRTAQYASNEFETWKFSRCMEPCIRNIYDSNCVSSSLDLIPQCNQPAIQNSLSSNLAHSGSTPEQKLPCFFSKSWRWIENVLTRMSSVVGGVQVFPLHYVLPAVDFEHGFTTTIRRVASGRLSKREASPQRCSSAQDDFVQNPGKGPQEGHRR